MSNINNNSPEQVVGYYNLYKLDNKYNKDNRDNKYVDDLSSSPHIDNIFGSIRSVPSPSGSVETSISLGSIDQGDSGGGVAAPEDEPILNEDMITRAVIQFFDNGEDAKQRFKIKVRFNLVDKENPEFIATLGKDWSNFTKYIPADCRDEIKELARALRSKIKDEYNTTPYMGKFHLNIGKQVGQTRGFTNIEPNTVAFVWFDDTNKHWKYWIMFYDFIRTGTFDATHLTKAQIKAGVKTQDLYINPKYDTVQRPKTWAERRKSK
jgi:hypothetical protein